MPDARHRTPVELLRALAVLAEPPEPGHARLAELVGLSRAPLPSEYSDVFLFQLYPYAAVHLGAEGMMGGEARARVAGFWEAVGQPVPAEPDHLSSLVGLYATLSRAVTKCEAAEAELLEQSRAALLAEHVAPWLFAYLWRVSEVGGGVYREWAVLLGDALRVEVERHGVGRGALSAHLRQVEAVPDPRSQGADDFVTSLLAPVRCGAILTRADLARIASRLDLGLRAGERRYALEHLLAQEPVHVLRALAAEFRRQRAAHEARRRWLGTAAGFHARRAGDTARMLLRLSADLSADAGVDHALAEAPPLPTGG